MILTYVILLPTIGALFLLFMNKANGPLMKGLGLAFSLGTFIVSLALYFGFDSSNTEMQFMTRVPWISGLNVFYTVGIDGLSLLLVLLTTFLTPLAMLSSWNSIEKRVKEFTIMMLLL